MRSLAAFAVALIVLDAGCTASQNGATEADSGTQSGHDAGVKPGNDAATQTGDDAGTITGTGSAAQVAMKLGRPAQFLVGLGNDGGGDAFKLGVALDFRYVYLTAGWRSWNSPDGDYVALQSQAAKQHNVIPMFTTWELPSLSSDGDTAAANDSTVMTQFWSDIETLYQKIAAYNDVAVVHFEPDWWGYCEQKAKEDPSKLPAKVTINSRCTDLSDDVGGMAKCLIKMGRAIAPKAIIGLHYTEWGAYNSQGQIDGTVAGKWLKALGADGGDIIVTDTVGLDRDCGCWEAGAPECMGRGSGPFCLDESNATSPNFHEQLALVKAMHDVLDRPVLWWQLPLGVPSATPGGTPGHYRDNRVHYLFSHVDEFVAVGGLGACFGTGAGNQTDVNTDGGQFKNAVTAYRASPVALP
jgi:hypothetical protein